MRKILTKIWVIPALLFLGCSTKDVFVPKHPKTEKLKSETQIKSLHDYTKNTLTFRELELKYVKKQNFLDDGIRGVWVYYDKSGKKLGKFKKLNKDLAVYGNKLLLIKEKKVIKLPYLVFSATRNDNLIAIVFENNSIGLYDLKQNKMIFYKENQPALGVKYFSAAPLFYNGLVLYPLLNGKVAVVDAIKHTFIRNLFIDDTPINDNIIFLKIVNNQLFMATPRRLVLFNPNFLIHYDAHIKHILSFDKHLYLFLVGGKIIEFNTSLKKLKEINLPFADYFAPSVCNGYIYTVTSNGYLLKISKNLKVTAYSGTKFDTTAPLRIDKCKIYNDNKVFFIE
jgi:hypothetical protein